MVPGSPNFKMSGDDRMTEPLRIPRLLTEREAAEALGVSPDTLTRERRRGRVTHTRIGGRIRYTEMHLSDIPRIPDGFGPGWPPSASSATVNRE